MKTDSKILVTEDLQSGKDGKYNPFTDTIKLRQSSVEGSSGVDQLTAVLMLVHEMTHSRQAASIEGLASLFHGVEKEAYEAMRMAALEMLKQGTINVTVYNFLINDINSREGEWEYHDPLDHEYMQTFMRCLACEYYRKYSTPYFQGLWGLETNPDGPASTPSAQAHAANGIR
ncbi:MAG TPA: hypothetical protein VFS15_27020 [Kofleriaceae bacterium]|nr:hypothetical protein [Kofleriaceae bacterium]